jgi:hypothetical protein
VAILDTIATAPAAAHSLRRLRADYAGAPIRAIRTSDSAERDIAFSGFLIDTADLLAWGAGTDVYGLHLYDQSPNSDGGTPAGSTRQATQATAGRRMRIASGGSLHTIASGRPALITPDTTARGYYGAQWGANHTGSVLSACAIGIIGTDAYSRLFSCRRHDRNDWNWPSTCTLYERRTGETNLVISRLGYLTPNLAITNGVPYSVWVRFDGTTMSYRRNGAAKASVASSGAFDINQILLGPEDDTTYRGQTGSYLMEAILWTADIGEADLDAVQADQASFWIDGVDPVDTEVNRLVPDAIVASTNLAGAVGAVQADDGTWLTATDATAATDVRVSYPSP